MVICAFACCKRVRGQQQARVSDELRARRPIIGTRPRASLEAEARPSPRLKSGLRRWESGCRSRCSWTLRWVRAGSSACRVPSSRSTGNAPMLAMKNVGGEPCAGEPHARFDGAGENHASRLRRALRHLPSTDQTRINNCRAVSGRGIGDGSGEGIGSLSSAAR
jgi:hypothetical protein